MYVLEYRFMCIGKCTKMNANVGICMCRKPLLGFKKMAEGFGEKTKIASKVAKEVGSQK